MKNITMQQIACMNMNFNYFPFEYFLDTAVDLGIQRIELWGGAPHLYYPYLSKEERKKIKQEIKARDLNAVSYTPEALFYPYNIASEHSLMREKSVEFLQNNIRFAAELEIPQVLLIAGRGYYNQSQKEAWKYSVDSIERILPVAEEEGIILMLEALQPSESNLVVDISSVKKMLDTINSKYLKTMIDTVQMTVAGESINQYFDVFADDICHVHLTEGSPAGHKVWGEGNLPLLEFLKALSEQNYEKTLSLEIGGYETDPVKALKQSVNVVSEVIQQL